MSASIVLLHNVANSRASIVQELQVHLSEDYASIFDYTVAARSAASSPSSSSSFAEPGNHHARTTAATESNESPQRRQQQQQHTTHREPDGYFNGGPIYKQRKKLSELASYAHCVGETYLDGKQAWKDKSCHFHFLCYNTSSYEYLLFENPSSRNLARTFAQRHFAHVSDSLHRHNHSDSVSLGGINLKWGHTGIPRIRWFPKILPLPPPDIGQHRELIYYELSKNTVMIPYHSLNGANPGHLVWDDFLPIYTLLGMFQLLNDEHIKYDLLPIRQVLTDGERGLWASCDTRPDNTRDCQHMISKFWSLLTGVNHLYKPTTNIQPILTEITPGTSKVVCSQHGIAGMGSLTDHGLYKAHGWEQADYLSVHNHGRGEQLYNFRNFMLRNMNMNPYYDLNQPVPDDNDHNPQNTNMGPPKYRIVFSQKSSEIYSRSMDFETQIQLVQDRFPQASVEHYVMKNLTLTEQLEITTRTSIYISLCGGGAVSAMFLPKGASVILYYAEDGGTKNGRRNYKPALLDYDLFNAMSYLRVHWLGRNTMKSTFDQEALLMLIEQELQIIQSQVFM